MSEDLDKLMKKLKPTSDKAEEPKAEEPKAEEPKAEEPKAEEPKAEVISPTLDPKPEIDDDEDEEDEDIKKAVETLAEENAPLGDEQSEPIPANTDEPNPIEHEVALLQNDGVFRRELLMVEKEKVDVLKVIAQTFIDIKKKLAE